MRLSHSADGKNRVILRLGFLRINLLKLLAGRKKRGSAGTRAKKEDEKKESSFPNTGLLFELAKTALHGFRKGVRIDRLELRLILGGESDPCAAALMYGRLHMAWGVLLPLLSEGMRLKREKVSFGLDFNSAKTQWDADASLTVSIGRIMLITLTLLGPVMKLISNSERGTKRAA